ncbi:MAG: UDP-3-O-[3-hydroxymyristoyl] glucosamine N-acyltransferase [Myxococcota bacterium]|jgi:UDP-3-O-[3-hydroxymyristoyl] glucosamine N-acyltransferase
MSLHHYASAGLAVLLMASQASAATCSGDPASDCDGDGISNAIDLCPSTNSTNNAQTTVAYADDAATPLPTGAACTHSGAEVYSGATIGTGVAFLEGTRVLDGSYVGDFSTIGGTPGESATVGVRARLTDAPTPELGTVFPSGVIGRNAALGDDPSSVPQAAREGDVTTGDLLGLGRSATVGFGARLGDGVQLGYAAVIGPQAVIGNNVIVGNLAEIGWGATVGDNFVLARSSVIGNFAVIGDNVVIGPEVTVGTYTEVGTVGGGPVRIRRGVEVGKWAVILGNVRIGRNSIIGDYSDVLAGVSLRADVTVLPGGVACEGTPPDPSIECAINGYYPRGAIVDGIADNVPAEPSGTFFSAAGGIVCANPGTNGCGRIPTVVDGITRYCLDRDGNGACDAGDAGVPAQAIVITAPDTIGVSPYCYNSGGSTVCETLQSPPGSCGGGGQPPCYQLQAGPIYVLSPPDN